MKNKSPQKRYYDDASTTIAIAEKYPWNKDDDDENTPCLEAEREIIEKPPMGKWWQFWKW